MELQRAPEIGGFIRIEVFERDPSATPEITIDREDGKLQAKRGSGDQQVGQRNRGSAAARVGAEFPRHESNAKVHPHDFQRLDEFLQPRAPDCIPRTNQELSGSDYRNERTTRCQLISYGACDLVVWSAPPYEDDQRGGVKKGRHARDGGRRGVPPLPR